MLPVANRCLIFDRSSGGWRLPYTAEKIDGRLRLIDGRLYVLDSDLKKRMVLLASKVPSPELGLRAAIGAEYVVLPAMHKRVMHHKDVMLVSFAHNYDRAALALVFFRQELDWRPDLVELGLNLTCLCNSLYRGRLLRGRYLHHLRTMEDAKDALLMLQRGA